MGNLILRLIPKVPPATHFHQNQQLQNLIDQCQHRSTVNLSRQNLNNEDMNIIVEQAIIKKQCEYLNLNANVNITLDGASIIAKALHNNTTLLVLQLSYNAMGDRGIHLLAEELNNSKLHTLSLIATGITDQGAEYLAEMLRTNTELRKLEIGNNAIGDRGVHCLTDALAFFNKTLRQLALNNSNNVSDASVNSLIHMLGRHRLDALWIKNCNFSSNGKERLRQSTTSNHSFDLEV
jgi:Ran GTPase-activating protein (RanGAP) involved in mRNA processing and transport